MKTNGCGKLSFRAGALCALMKQSNAMQSTIQLVSHFSSRVARWAAGVAQSHLVELSLYIAQRIIII